MVTASYFVVLKHVFEHYVCFREQLKIGNPRNIIMLETINKAKEHGLITLSFPYNNPRKQTLELSMCGLFKRCRNMTCADLTLIHPDRALHIHDVDALCRHTYVYRPFIHANITPILTKTGIYPVNSEFVKDHHFLTSVQTDGDVVPLPRDTRGQGLKPMERQTPPNYIRLYYEAVRQCRKVCYCNRHYIKGAECTMG